jgi:hypothetical protein
MSTLENMKDICIQLLETYWKRCLGEENKNKGKNKDKGRILYGEKHWWVNQPFVDNT